MKMSVVSGGRKSGGKIEEEVCCWGGRVAGRKRKEVRCIEGGEEAS